MYLKYYTKRIDNTWLVLWNCIHFNIFLSIISSWCIFRYKWNSNIFLRCNSGCIITKIKVIFGGINGQSNQFKFIHFIPSKVFYVFVEKEIKTNTTWVCILKREILCLFCFMNFGNFLRYEEAVCVLGCTRILLLANFKWMK